jgi:hypothetical protein
MAMILILLFVGSSMGTKTGLLVCCYVMNFDLCSLISDHSPLFWLVLVETVAKQQDSSEKIAFQLWLRGSSAWKKEKRTLLNGRILYVQTVMKNVSVE